MNRSGIGLVAATLLLAAGCTSAESAVTTLLPLEPTTTTTVPAPPTTPPPDTAAPVSTTTTTTLAPIPSALPIVSDTWEWTQLLEIEYPFDARYDGTYLVYREPDSGPIVAVKNGATVLRHTPPTDEEWIVQDVELGDHWLAIVENTEAGNDTTHLVVYDLVTGDVVFEEFGEEVDGRIAIPHVSLSGRYMALAMGQETPSSCVAIYDLAMSIMIHEICSDAPVRRIELDGSFFGLSTYETDCSSAWTGTLYGQDHNLVAHTNRECWANWPVGGDRITVWFESIPGTVGIDTMIGENAAGEAVGLGRGVNGTSEACWNRAYWIGGNGDIRTWAGGDTVTTIYSSEETAYRLGCVGPWITLATTEAIYTANMFTGSALDACDVVDAADRADQTNLAATLGIWAHDRFDDLPSDLVVSVASAVGSDGWWVGQGGFSDQLEGAIFAWSPDGDVSVAWSGNADSAYEIRQYMLSLLPEAPPALFGCVDVDGYFS